MSCLWRVLEIQVQLGPDPEQDPGVVDAPKFQDALDLGNGDVEKNATLRFK